MHDSEHDEEISNPFQSHSTPTSAAAAWILRGVAVVGMMGVPMGPFGALAGVVVGGLGALCVGFLHDALQVRALKNEVGVRIQRLEHLVRWTEFVYSQSEHPGLMLLYLCKEFEPLVSHEDGAARPSRTRTSLLESLAAFLRREDVQSVATQYLETFFHEWRRTGVDDIKAFDCVLRVCSGAFAREKKVPAVYERMTALRHNPAVQQLLRSAAGDQNRPNDHWLMALDDDQLQNTTIDRLFRATIQHRFKPGQVKRALSTAEDPARPPARSRTYAKMAPEPPIPWINELALDRAAAPDADSWAEVASVPAHDAPPRAVAIDVGDAAFARHESLRHSCSLAGDVVGPSVALIEHPSRQPSRPRLPDFADDAETLTQEQPEPPASPAADAAADAPESPAPPAVPSPAAPPAAQPPPSPQSAAPQTAAVMPKPAAAPAGTPATQPAAHPTTTTRPRRRESPPKVRLPPAAGATAAAAGRAALRAPPAAPRTADLEKKFFENFTDFTDFDPDLKHKIPIGRSEFDLLDEFLVEEPIGAWQLAVSKGATRVYKQVVNVGGSDLVMVKGYAVFERQTIETLIYNLRDLSRRTAWDKTFDCFTLVEADVFGNEIVYNTIRAPWPVADREFLQWRRMLYVSERGGLRVDGDPPAPADAGALTECRIFHRSAEHPGYPMPKAGANVIRAESVISAYVFTKLPNSGGVKLMLLTQCDIKGVVPKWLVNSQAAKAPVQWLENFKKACDETRARLGNDLPKYTPKAKFTNAIRIDHRNLTTH